MNSIINNKNSIPTCICKFFNYCIIIFVSFPISSKTISFYFERLSCLVKSLLKRSPNSHNFPYRFHLQSKNSVWTFKFVKIPTRYLNNYIINRGLKQCWCRFCNLVIDFIQSVTYCQFCSNFSYRISWCFWCQRWWSRNSWINFNCNNFFFFIWTYRKLNIATPSKVSNISHHFYCHVPHSLKCLIR